MWPAHPSCLWASRERSETRLCCPWVPSPSPALDMATAPRTSNCCHNHTPAVCPALCRALHSAHRSSSDGPEYRWAKRGSERCRHLCSVSQLGGRRPWSNVAPALPLTCCVTWGLALTLSGPTFLHLDRKAWIGAFSTGCGRHLCNCLPGLCSASNRNAHPKLKPYREDTLTPGVGVGPWPG